MLNEVYLVAIPVTCCCLRLPKRDELSYSLRGEGDHAGLKYLKTAKDIFMKWKASDTVLSMRPLLPAYKLYMHF